MDSDNYLLVVGEVVLREISSFPVTEPLVADLVAVEVEVPDVLGDSHETDGAGLRRAMPSRALVFWASSQTVPSDQPTRPTSGFFGPA